MSAEGSPLLMRAKALWARYSRLLRVAFSRRVRRFWRYCTASQSPSVARRRAALGVRVGFFFEDPFELFDAFGIFEVVEDFGHIEEFESIGVFEANFHLLDDVVAAEFGEGVNSGFVFNFVFFAQQGKQAGDNVAVAHVGEGAGGRGGEFGGAVFNQFP